MKKTSFSSRKPDRMMEELVGVLSSGKAFEFKPLFAVVHENLRAQNAAAGGEEMMRLRAYEKLQNLVRTGMVAKEGKAYKGDASALANLAASMAESATKANELAAAKVALRSAEVIAAAKKTA